MIIFFGNIIIQFEWKKQWQNTLNMCYNYSMHLLFIYSALTGQLYSATSTNDLTIKRVKIKILLIVLQKLYSYNVIVYTIIHFATIIGNCKRINQLLREKSLEIVYHDKQNSINVFIVIGSLYILFCLPLSMMLIDDFFNTPWFIIMKVLFLLFYINFIYYYTWIVVFYVKHATFKRLKMIYDDLSSSSSLSLRITDDQNQNQNQKQQKCKRKKLFNEIQLLARNNRHTNELLSMPLSIFFISTFIDVVGTFYYFLDKNEFFMFIFYLIVMFPFLIYIVHLNDQNEMIFQQIIQIIYRKNVKNMFPVNTDNYRSTKHILLAKTNLKMKQKKFFLQQMRIKEFFDVYVDDFHLNIYQLFRIDQKFFLLYSLSLLAYIVLSLQTSDEYSF
ncbi:uncharacterized protein LOC142597297 isoform X2 [Dermatophagoides farinae]